MDPSQTTPGATATGERSHLSNPATWMRGLFMLLLLLAFGIAQGLLWILALVQFLWLLFAGEPNPALVQFGRSLSRWLQDTGRFIVCASEAKPFPWAPWPSGE